MAAHACLKDFKTHSAMVVFLIGQFFFFFFFFISQTDDVIMGTVGDRRLILLLQGDRASKYNPVLEIRSPTDSLHDRIVYRKYY